MNYRFTDRTIGYAQLDMNSESIEDSKLTPFGHSLQLQLGLGFDNWLDNYRVDLFFSEDILVGTAPDITFGARLSTGF